MGLSLSFPSLQAALTAAAVLLYNAVVLRVQPNPLVHGSFPRFEFHVHIIQVIFWLRNYQISLRVSFLNPVDPLWGSTFLPTEKLKIHFFENPSHFWRNRENLTPDFFQNPWHFNNLYTGSSNLNNDLPGIQGRPIWHKKWTFQRLKI